MKHRLRALVPLFALTASPLPGASPESGNESGITVQLHSPAVTWRENAPFPLIVTVSRRGPGVLSGRLELSFTDGRALAGTLRTPRLAFMGAAQSYRLLVPPLRASATWEQLSVKIRLIGDGDDNGDDGGGEDGDEGDVGEDDIALGEQLLFVAPNAAKKRLLGVCAPPGDAEMARVVRGLRLEAFRESPDATGLSTMPWTVPAAELSTDAIHYCLYDALLFDATHLGELTDEQHRALAVWVKAGGRLLVLAGPVPGRRSRAFLESLEREGSEVSWPRWHTADPAGAEPGEGSLRSGDLRLARAGLGRVVVAVEAPSEEDLRSPAWKQVIAFLWNLSDDEEKRLLRPRASSAGSVRMRRPVFAGWTNAGDGFSHRGAERALIAELAPKDVRVIPPVVIGIILAAFAFVVGPLDYLVLGFFGRRRLTWIVFPLTCVAFSVVTLRLSEIHLGAHDFQRSMSFVDVGRGGEVLRASEYRLSFGARSGHATSRARGEMLTLCQNEDGALPRYSTGFVPDARLAESRYEAGDLPVYEGQFPAGYGMRYRVRQWSPSLERRFRLGPGGEVPDLDWDALEALDGAAAADRDRVRGLLVGARVFRGSIHVLAGGATHTVALPDVPNVTLPKQLFERPSRHLDPESFHPFVGPAGGPGFDDLPLLDTERPGEFLVVVVEEKEGDLTFYRRLYHGGGP